MSGYKRATISISQDEYNRLRDAEVQLRTAPSIPAEVLQSISQRSYEAVQDNLNRMQQRQRGFENMVSGMNQSIQSLERDTSQALVALESNLLGKTQEYVGGLYGHFNQLLNQHLAQFEQTIAANHHYLQDELAQQSRQLRRLEGDAQRKQEMAEMWLDSAEQFCAFIHQNYAHQQFLPGEMEWLERQLIQTRSNLGVGLAEAVIVNAQQLYTAFSDMRIRLERLQNDWLLLHQSAWEAVTLILSRLEASRVVAAVDLEGNELETPIETDYWTDGRLSELERDLNYIRERLEDPETQLNWDILNRWLDIDLPSYDDGLCHIVGDARVTALNSQLRINIADLVIQALQEQGFALEASDYQSSDMRDAFNAHLSSLEGNEVVVNVVPVGRNVGENELHLQSIDREEHTEHELQQRWVEVDRSLTAYGLDVSNLTRIDVNETRSNNRREQRQQQSVQIPIRR